MVDFTVTNYNIKLRNMSTKHTSDAKPKSHKPKNLESADRS